MTRHRLTSNNTRGYRFAALFVASAVVTASSTATAQDAYPDATGTIAGVAIDSVRGGYLRDAIVSVSGTDQSATTDSVGQFRVDGVRVGMHTLRVRHPLLDTLSISLVTELKEVRAGETLRLAIAVPSAATIVTIKCSASDRARGAGALMGTVTDADSESPSAGAEVEVAWTDYEVGNKSVKRLPQSRTAKVRIDGTYLVCGIPDDLSTGVVAFRGEDSTSAVPVNFEQRLAVQSFSLPGTPPPGLAASEESSAAGARGTSMLNGTVLDPAGKPLQGARVAIESDDATTLTRADGTFTLRGARSGTRSLSVRKLGFEPVDRTVNLSSAKETRVVIQVQKSVQTLEAVKVSALRDIGLQRIGFTERQKLASGKFFTPSDIERRNPLKLNYLLEAAPMLRTGQTAEGKRYVNGRGGWPCLRYYIDGVLMSEVGPTELDMLPDSYLSTAELGAVEVYGRLNAPPQFFAMSRSGQVCSVVVIWTKHKLGVR